MICVWLLAGVRILRKNLLRIICTGNMELIDRELLQGGDVVTGIAKPRPRSTLMQTLEESVPNIVKPGLLK